MKGAIVADGYVALSTIQREKHSIEAHESSVVLVLIFLFSVNGVIDRGERFLTRPLRLLTALLHTYLRYTLLCGWHICIGCGVFVKWWTCGCNCIIASH